jgi:large subunit ribosomal protein L4
VSAVEIKDQAGQGAGSVQLDEAIFGIEPNVPVMHQVVTAQLAARRAGTQSTRTRAEVAGGGSKPWRQKGTGRSRQGSIRAPHWRGGGVALGPKPRSYKQRTPKKMVQLALRSALSDRAAEGKVAVIDAWDFDQPSTKGAVAALEALELDGRVLVVLGDGDRNAWLSFRNLGRVHCLSVTELNAYDILCNDWVVFTRATLPGATEEQQTPVRVGKAAKAPAEAADETTPVAEDRASKAEGRVAQDSKAEGRAAQDDTEEE